MSKTADRRRRNLLWLLSVVVVGSMLCPLAALISTRQPAEQPPTRVVAPPTQTTGPAAPSASPAPQMTEPAPPLSNTKTTTPTPQPGLTASPPPS